MRKSATTNPAVETSVQPPATGGINLQTVLALVQGLNKPKTHSLEVGRCYLFRTVTYHSIGRVTRITDLDIELEDASWVASSGRYSTALEEGKLEENEKIPAGKPHFLMLAAIVDFDVWDHPVPVPTT